MKGLDGSVKHFRLGSPASTTVLRRDGLDNLGKNSIWLGKVGVLGY